MERADSIEHTSASIWTLQASQRIQLFTTSHVPRAHRHSLTHCARWEESLLLWVALESLAGQSDPKMC